MQRCRNLLENVKVCTLIFWHNYNAISPTQKMKSQEYFNEAKECLIQPESDWRVKNSSPVPYSLLPNHDWKVTTLDNMLLADEQVKYSSLKWFTLDMGHVEYAVISSSSELSTWSSIIKCLHASSHNADKALPFGVNVPAGLELPQQYS